MNKEDNKKKLFVMANIITLIFILIFDLCYMVKGGLFFKSIASIAFVATGIINFMYCIKKKTDLKFPIWMVIALIFAMLGDILLLINFYVGTAAFAVGHIFYFVSYCMLERINRRDFICGISILVFSLAIILFTPFLKFENNFMQGVCCVYAIIISFMVGKAISNLLNEKNSASKIIAIGSILFFVSDFMLMLDKFGGISVASYLCLGTYYPAQFLLAFSLFIDSPINSLKQEKAAV